MRRLAAAGDRAAAIRTFERLSRRFRDELRIVPSQATRALAEELRRGGEGTPPEPLEVSPGPPSAADAPVAAAIVTLLFTDLVGSTALLRRWGMMRPSACDASTSDCCATWLAPTAGRR